MSKVKKQEQNSAIGSRTASMSVLSSTDNKKVNPYAKTWIDDEQAGRPRQKYSVSFVGLKDNVFVENNATTFNEKLADDDSYGVELSESPIATYVGKQSKKSKLLSTFINFRRGSLMGLKKEPKDFTTEQTKLRIPSRSKSIPCELIHKVEEAETKLPKFHQNQNIMIYEAKDEPTNGDQSSVKVVSEEDQPKSDNDTDGHVNLLFQFDEDLEPTVRMTQGWTFGKKGNGIGDFQDACHVNYVSKGNVYVTDMINSRITIFNSSGTPVAAFHGEEIIEPWACALTLDGNIAVTSRKEKCVVVMSKDGSIVNSFGHGFFRIPSGIAVDKDGRFIISDIETNQVSIHERNGKWIKYLGNSVKPGQTFKQPRYVAASSRHIIVSDSGNNCIKLFDERGHFRRKIGKFGSRDGDFKYPYGVCTDTLGDIYVADHYNNRISMFSPEGEFVRHLITSQHCLKLPQGIALSPELNMYVSHGGLKACEISVFKLQCHSDKQKSASNIEGYL